MEKYHVPLAVPVADKPDSGKPAIDTTYVPVEEDLLAFAPGTTPDRLLVAMRDPGQERSLQTWNISNMSRDASAALAELIDLEHIKQEKPHLADLINVEWKRHFKQTLNLVVDVDVLTRMPAIASDGFTFSDLFVRFHGFRDGQLVLRLRVVLTP